jgi:hypothetical protein
MQGVGKEKPPATAGRRGDDLRYQAARLGHQAKAGPWR